MGGTVNPLVVGSSPTRGADSPDLAFLRLGSGERAGPTTTNDAQSTRTGVIDRPAREVQLGAVQARENLVGRRSFVYPC